MGNGGQPVIRRLQFRQPPAFQLATTTVIDPALSYPRTHQYSVSFQREIGFDSVIEINYVGRQGRKLFGAYDANQVEFRNNGVPVASFRLAHTPRVRRNGEWADAATTWITVTCFRALAENVTASIHKGQPVLVAGRLRTNVWTKEGVTYELTVDDFRGIDEGLLDITGRANLLVQLVDFKYAM